MPARRLYDHELFYVVSGFGRIVIEGVSHDAPPNTLFYILPGVPHSFHAATNGEEWISLGIHFDWTTQSDTLHFPIFEPNEKSDPFLLRNTLSCAPHPIPGWDNATRPFLNLRGRPQVFHFLEETCVAYAAQDGRSKMQAGALLIAAILQIQREVEQLARQSRSEAASPDAHRRIEQATALLEQIREKPLTMAQIASRVGWSADHMAAMFRVILGTSPRKIQHRARIRHAKTLLQRGELSIAEVARSCGFYDSSHLSRALKEDSGLSARQFIRMSKKL